MSLAADMHAAGVGMLEACDHPQASWSCRSPTGPNREKNSPAAMSSVTCVDGQHLAVERLGDLVELDGSGASALLALQDLR